MVANTAVQAEYEAQLKDIIQGLYALLIQTNSFGNAGPGIDSRQVICATIETLHNDLKSLHSAASSPAAPVVQIPPELVQYVDSGRNPDIYTREFVELARRGNQLMKGKKEAFGSFRDVLAQEINSAMPELQTYVQKVVTETGGQVSGGLSQDKQPSS